MCILAVQSTEPVTCRSSPSPKSLLSRICGDGHVSEIMVREAVEYVHQVKIQDMTCDQAVAASL